MTPERWQKVEQVFQAALDLPQLERAAFLNEVCGGDHELKHETCALIEAYDRASDFIEEPALAHDAHLFIDNEPRVREIGPYSVIDRIGAGGMAEVFLARDVRLNRMVALKTLPAYFVTDEAHLKRFQNEARTASALNHANILTIYEVGQFEEVHFLAAEYVEGQTFRELIREGRLLLGEVVDLSIQVLSGLSAAHAAGIVHRDIKPENLMRRRDGVVKILDFGVAKLLEQPTKDFSPSLTAAETEIGVLVGTVGYMSPEQIRCLALDERSDVWSAGIVLYELLTGRRPFEGATRADAIAAILAREPARLFEVDGGGPAELREIQKIVSKALQKDRTGRYQTAADMLLDLRVVQQQLTSENRPINSNTAVTELTEIASRTVQTRSYLLMIAVAAMLVIIFAGLLLYQRSNRAAAPPPTAKRYSQMNEAEQLAFLSEQEQHISAMMGERPARLNDEALRAIKNNVDRYAVRIGSTSLKPGQEDLMEVYQRATMFVPLIAHSFSERRIPVIVGIYLPMIESEYKPCYENSAGAKGLFQFLPQTAAHYGVAHGEMCDVEKMTPAAAHYIADRMAELGDDSQSMTLVLLSYNRGTDGVLEALRLLRETDKGYERNFWTLFANREKLDAGFRRESAYYVPNFFGAAIIGENPEVFGLQTQPLSKLAR
jgi:serine/threonine protein kinase